MAFKIETDLNVLGNPVCVSVIIPCYNRERFLPETLRSVAAQTFRGWEAVIVDDRSEDRSLEVAQAFQEKDERFRVFLRGSGKKGANVCRNEGIKRARGDYLIFLDSDDLLDSSALRRRVDAMSRAPQYDFGVFQTEIFHETVGDCGMVCRAFQEGNDLHRFLGFDAAWHTSGPIWRRQTVELLGGFDESLPSLQDWDIHVRSLIAGFRYFKVSVRDSFYRMSPNNKNSSIGAKFSKDPLHLKSHEMLFERVVVRLQESGLLDGSTKRRLAGLFWWLATRYRVTQGWGECRRVWRRAYQLGLLSRRHYWEGNLVSQLSAAIPGGRHLARPILKFWPKEHHTLFSKYMHNVSVETLDGSVIWCGFERGQSHVKAGRPHEARASAIRT